MSTKDFKDDEEVTRLDDLLYSLENGDTSDSSPKRRKSWTEFFKKKSKSNKIHPKKKVQATNIPRSFKIPFWVISVSRFLKLYESGARRLERHAILKERGDLVNLQMTKSHGPVIFVSHEWGSYRHPDPNGCLVHVLCKSLRKC